MKIGKKIQLLRKNVGITQEQLAKQLQVSRQTISKWEAGVSLPDIESIVKMGNLFQVPLEELLREDDCAVMNDVSCSDNSLQKYKEDETKENAVSFQTLEELAKVNMRNRIIILIGVAVLTFILGVVLGSIFVNKLDHTTSKLEYTLHQYMELEGKVTALVDTNAKEQVLLVTDLTYDDGTGRQVSIMCDVYYSVNNKVRDLGTIMSGGTAYPITADRTGIYTAGGHSVERYVIDERAGELKLVEAMYEIYDENGDVAYEKEVNGVRGVSSENEFMDMIKRYARATPVGFQ